MNEQAVEVTVAGHICLDIIPSFQSSSIPINELFVPGKLIAIGNAVTSTGGAVSNTGLALHRLGVTTQLMGKVGDDLFGQGILALLRKQGEGLDSNMIISAGEQSSYSVVISPPNVDRIFLHCTGTNDTFTSSDLRLDKIAKSRIFHFGYPPLMQKMFENGGTELVTLLESVKNHKLTVTLDMAKPDPHSIAGQIDWKNILQRALPYVDVFFPSFEEILFMLDRSLHDQFHAAKQGEDIIALATPDILRQLTMPLLEWGAAVVVLKLGEHGLYVRTSADIERWKHTGRSAPPDLDNWLGRELLAPNFQVEVAGTTGAGDCTIAGFLTGLLKGFSLEETLTAAVAVGACNVEQSDAISGIPHWDRVKERMENGWSRRNVKLQLDGWRCCERSHCMIGQDDAFFDRIL